MCVPLCSLHTCSSYQSISLYIAILLHFSTTTQHKQTNVRRYFFRFFFFLSCVFHFVLLHVLYVLYTCRCCWSRRRRRCRRRVMMCGRYFPIEDTCNSILFKSRAWFNKFNHSATFSNVYPKIPNTLFIQRVMRSVCNVRHVCDLLKWQKPWGSVSALHAWSYLLLRKWECVRVCLFECSIQFAFFVVVKFLVAWHGIGNLNIDTAGTYVKYRAFKSREEIERERRMPHMNVNLFKFYNESVLLLLCNRVFFVLIVLFLLLFFVFRESCWFRMLLVQCMDIVILRWTNRNSRSHATYRGTPCIWCSFMHTLIHSLLKHGIPFIHSCPVCALEWLLLFSKCFFHAFHRRKKKSFLNEWVSYVRTLQSPDSNATIPFTCTHTHAYNLVTHRCMILHSCGIAHGTLSKPKCLHHEIEMRWKNTHSNTHQIIMNRIRNYGNRESFEEKKTVTTAPSVDCGGSYIHSYSYSSRLLINNGANPIYISFCVPCRAFGSW